MNMKKYLDSIDYVIPIFSGMPPLFKYIFCLWFFVGVLIIIFFLLFYYQKNRTEAAETAKHKVEVVKTLLNRNFDDFEFELNRLKRNFPKEERKLTEKLGMEYNLYSGQEVVEKCELGIKYQETLFDLKNKLNRANEDILLENHKTKNITSVKELKEDAKRFDDLLKLYEEKMVMFAEPALKLAEKDGRAKKIVEEYFKIQ